MWLDDQPEGTVIAAVAGSLDSGWVGMWLALPDATAGDVETTGPDPHWERVTFVGHGKKQTLVRTHGRLPASDAPFHSAHGDYHFRRHELLHFTAEPRG